jgi:hypothetical protein
VESVEAYVDAMAAAIGLPIAPEHRPGVVRYVAMVAALAPSLMETELLPSDESGNVFQPVEPPQ